MDIESLVANCRDYWLGWGSAERVDGQLAYSSKRMAWPASMSSQLPRTNGTALTVAALEAGRERGLSVGTLQASPSGFPVYERMGFRTVAAYELFRVSPQLLDRSSESGNAK